MRENSCTVPGAGLCTLRAQLVAAIILLLFLLLIIIISTCDSHLRRIRDISPRSGIPPNDIDLNSQLPLFSPPTH